MAKQKKTKKPATKPVTKEQRAIAMARRGKSITEIKDAVKLHPLKVYHILRREGLVKAPKPRKDSKPKPAAPAPKVMGRPAQPTTMVFPAVLLGDWFRMGVARGWIDVKLADGKLQATLSLP